MKSLATETARFLALLALFALTAGCSGSAGVAGADGANTPGGGGGIVGTGKQAVFSGRITGFGSVIVDGIEFSRSTSPGISPTPITLAFDGSSTSSEAALSVGMLVSVTGSYDTASGKGSYDQIVYSPELRGPLDNGSVDPVTGAIRVLGRSVQIDAAAILDGFADLNALAAQQGQRPEIEVSGYLDSQGIIHASRVALKAASSTTVQLKGTVGAVSAGSFVLGQLTVSITGANFVNMTAQDLSQPGLVVEVRGNLSGSTVSSARIERKAFGEGLTSGSRVHVKGVAAGPVTGGRFILSGPDGPLSVTAATATYLRGKAQADSSIVVAGAELEVEGLLQADGSLLADSVAAETQRNLRLEGDLQAVNPAGTLTINGVTIKVDSVTSLRDNRKSPAPVENLNLAAMVPGDHLKVEGLASSQGIPVATQIERFDASPVAIIQGPVTSVDTAGSRLTILGAVLIAQPGCSFSTGSLSANDFPSFATRITQGVSVVKAKGIFTLGTFVASSMELQQ